MPSSPIVERIARANAGREPERLALKYQAMRRNALGFLRGTNHLFHEDWPERSPLDETPRAWITGDLHLENFGSYKGDNRLVYFDLNDFDDAALAPCSRDLARFVTSVFVAAKTLGVRERDARSLATRFLSAYRSELAEGKARWVERQIAEGLVLELLERAIRLTRKGLLQTRTILGRRGRRLRLGRRALPISEVDRERVAGLLARFAGHEEDPGFYRLLDAARRVAGNASLGLERYVLLVEGRGSPDRNYILDLKQAAPTNAVRASSIRAGHWTSEAERIVTIQRWVQAVSPALLHPVRAGGRSYVLRELQPSEDRLSIQAWRGGIAPLEGVMAAMGQIVAWSHLRSGGRKGSATTDEWIGFAERKGWDSELIAHALPYSRRIERDWREFVEATG